MAHLNISEKAIVDAVTRHGDTDWRCKYCGERFNDVIPVVTHSILECPASFTAGSLNTMSTSSVVIVCAHLDPEGCSKMLESYRRVYGVPPASEFAGRIDLGEDDVPMASANEIDDDSDRDLSSQSESETESESAEYAAQTFPATPPPHLSETDKKKWRHHHSRTESTKIRQVMESHRRPQPPHAVDQEAAVKAWNREWGWMPQFAPYGKFPAMSSRISRDRQLLRGLLVGRGMG